MVDSDHHHHRYKIKGKIGEGIHGCVLKAIDRQTGKLVAIKKIILRNKHNEISKSTIREVKTLQICNSDYIVKLLDQYPDVLGIALVLEFMPYTLYSKLKDADVNPLNRNTVRSYTWMILQGLQYMHGIGIMHRDIKPGNLLIDENDNLKIADFGLARLYSDTDKDKEYSPQVASRWYRAPELLWGSAIYGPPIDLWAVGCIFAEMLRGIPLFNGSTDIEQLALVVSILGKPSVKDWPEVVKLPDYYKIGFPPAKHKKWENLFPTCTLKIEIGLVNDLVIYNPQKRLTAKQALDHIYFQRSDTYIRLIASSNHDVLLLPVHRFIDL